MCSSVPKGSWERLKGFLWCQRYMSMAPCYTHSKHLLFSEIYCRKWGSVGDTYYFTAFLLVRAPWVSSRNLQPLPMCVDSSAWSRNRCGQDSDLTTGFSNPFHPRGRPRKGTWPKWALGLPRFWFRPIPFQLSDMARASVSSSVN